MELENLEIEVRKTCGCNPEAFSVTKAADGEHEGNIRLSKGSWIVGFKVAHDGNEETQQITLKVE